MQQKAPATDPPWQVLAGGLIEKVLEDHHLPARMARFLPEDANSAVDDTSDELFGLHKRRSEERGDDGLHGRHDD